jgi:hypothetical protein
MKIYQVFYSTSSIFKNGAPKTMCARSVIPKDKAVNLIATEYVWMLNNISNIFSSQNEKIQKITELLT